MIGTPQKDGDGYLALLLLDRLVLHLKEAGVIDQLEVSAWVDELREDLGQMPITQSRRAALEQLNASRIGH